MLRGLRKVRCTHCGHVFMAADIEDKATVKSMRIFCPECGKEYQPHLIRAILSRFLLS